MRPLLLALALTFASACGGGDSTLTIRNSSSFALIEINLSPVDASTFGPDLLGSEILEPGDELEISDIDCDDYDIRVVDEDGAECILLDIELCFDDALWEITDAELFSCAAFVK